MTANKSSWLRRHSPWILTGLLCAAKIAGAGIPLWLCLAPALLPIAVAVAVIASVTAFLMSVLIGYAVAAVYGLATGKEFDV